MWKPKIVGTLAPVGQPAEVDFDPVRGLIVHSAFQGAGNNLAGLAGFYIANRVAFRWKISPVRSNIEATYSGGQLGLASDVPQTNWQLLGNEVQKDIFESGIALAGQAAFPNLFKHVKEGVSLLQSGDIAGEADLQENDLATGEYQYYGYLVFKLTSGQTHWASGQYVARRTLSISNFFNGGMSGEGNVGRLISMVDFRGYGMPPVMVARLDSIPVPDGHLVTLGTVSIQYSWGWRQLGSQMVTGAQNRVEVSTEWWWDEWDTVLYPPA